MSVHLPGGALPAAALVALVAITLPLAASAQVSPATPIWSTYVGGSATDRISAVTQLSDGVVVAVGTTSSRNLDPNPPSEEPLPSGQQIFVAYADLDGAMNQEYPFLAFGGTGTDEPMAATLGPNQELYIVGRTTSTTESVTGAGTVLRSSSSGGDAFLVRLNALGRPDWFLFLSGSAEDVATGVTAVGSSVYVSGWTSSPDFLGRPGNTPGGVNGFVVRVDPTETAASIGWGGTPQLIGGSGTDTLRGITSGPGSKLLVAGTTTTTLLHSSLATNVYKGGSSDAFAAMLDAGTGALEWLTFVGGPGTDEGNAIATGLAQSYVVAGTTSSTDPDDGRPPADKNAFVASLNGVGTQRLLQVRGGSSDDEALTVTTDSYGTAYVGGRTASSNFPGAANGFDSGIESGTELREGFVWVAPPEGGDGWASFVGGSGAMDAVKALSQRSSNRLILGLDTDSSSGLPGPFVYDSSPSTPTDGYILSVSVRDPIPPSPAGQVFDRLQLDDVHEDVEETTSARSIFANWTAFTDSQTGIVKYEWAIGTTENPTSVWPFTSVGTQRSAMATGLTLSVGQSYIVTVRAQNGVGLTSIARSNGITVVPAPPPPDGGTGSTDGGTGSTDGGMDGGLDAGMDGGTGSTDGGGGSVDDPREEPRSPAGWGCASTGGVGLPLLLGLIALILRGRARLPRS